MNTGKGLARRSGFTLIEVVVVVVIISIIGSIGSHFVVSALDSYRSTETRQKLTHRARLTVEQMGRELRAAVPNSARVSVSGNCIEFLPTVAATRYLHPLPTQNNGQAATSSVDTSGYDILLGQSKYLVVAPFSGGEVYTSVTPSAIASIASMGAAPTYTVTLAAAHTFMRNSMQQRVFIANDPVRFCVSGETLVRHSGYGLPTSALGDASPGGNTALMAHGVVAIGSAFTMSPGSEDRNTSVQLNLKFNHGGESVGMRHAVAIRNVP